MTKTSKMNINEQVMTRFYEAFKKRDAKTIAECYSENPVFNDPVFGIIQGDYVIGMWEMLCEKAQNFSLEFSNVNADEEYGTCNWAASYTFSKTGRRVVNKVKAHMRFANGKITEHTDQFNFQNWAKQALGLPGYLLGWSSYLKNKVRKQAHGQLMKYMDLHYPVQDT